MEIIRVLIGSLPDGKDISDLKVATNNVGDSLGITLKDCKHACPKGEGCDISRCVRLRKIGQPVNIILCGKQTVVSFISSGADKPDSQLLQCVNSPQLID